MMAKSRTIHTPDAAAKSINFAGARITEIHRVDTAGGHVKYACALGRGYETLFEKMGWTLPGEKTKSEKLEGKFEGGSLIHSASDKLVNAEYDIAYLVLSDFEMIRLEIEGKKKKGFRRELRFKATFKEQDACAKLEAYMFESDNARGPLKVTYYPEQVQEDLELTEEQRQATLKEND
jgi:hypothetical protein